MTVEQLFAAEPAPARLRPGFGVSPQDWADLAVRLARSPLARAVLLEGEPEVGVEADRVLKRDPRNVLITRPSRTDAEDHLTSTGAMAFEAALAVPDGTEMILDHTIGQRHVPGMLIIEAMIQLLTAAVPRCFPRREDSEWIGVMHGCRFSFSRFTFPSDARLAAELRVAGSAAPDRVPMAAEVVLSQAGRDTAVGSFALNAFSLRRLSDIEISQEAGVFGRQAADGSTTHSQPADGR
ncbi:AfsA-related hotdog domain-containing protein [Kitasatospora putterlickiae]|uniref:AfsA-related hotdog domain-containing protein n=1 Tax=Kitasatospora putterlickiae TaxID=221725 RepID=UPI0031DF85E7